MENRPGPFDYQDAPINSSLSQALEDIRTIMGNTMDLNIMEVIISGNSCAVINIEGMMGTVATSQVIYKYLMGFEKQNCQPADIFDYVTTQSLLTNDRKTIFTYGDLVRFAFSGFGIVLIDGVPKAVALGIQGYDKRSISEPSTEINVKGSHEGFIEVVRSNISLVRRRLKTPLLRFEMMQIGSVSGTDVCIAYMEGRARKKYVDEIRRKLSSIKLDTVLTSGYLSAFLGAEGKNIFSGVFTTERPDVFCAKLNEGRVGILIDGTPFALVCPSVFIENFFTMDDYVSKPFYSTYIRWIRYICFFLTIAMPGLYVALATYHPETFSHKLLLNLAASEEGTPFPLYVEIFILMIFYEIMREAGIRLPRAVGGAVSIVGGLIIGDAAVKSGLVSGPILIIIGITATASFVIPSLNEQTSVLRLVYIAAGGLAGIFGIGLATAALTVSICSMDDYGVPYAAPFSPFTLKSFLKSLGRTGFRRLAKEKNVISDLNGTD